MKVHFLLFTLLIPISVISQYDYDSLSIKAINNQNPELWDYGRFEEDKKIASKYKTEPLSTVAFPLEDYSFGVFSRLFEFKIGPNQFSGISFGENKENKNGEYVKRNYTTLIFFSEDSIISIAHEVSSRNNPYVTFQGSAKANTKYDFVGIKSPDNFGFLMISMKAFDLRFGSTILIFPRTDNSFFYLQLNDSPKDEENLESFVNRIKNSKKIGQMLELREE
ncbi:hypothetical protein [uncultured Eudoraea sp.]|uniref:hypothetical protein n=1 Tax=uncultured Eudoraea sp. TaxID=1035614 RepID=UPI00261A54DF|nr:hypothetical protein [uncultured Eudoraea sp.]